MGKSGKHSVQGSWRGSYFYSHDPGTGYGFEAVFVEHNGRVDGNILDDGKYGEATVGGVFAYPDLRFTKVYMRGMAPVKYHGTMSEDGNLLIGRWVIPGEMNTHGTWRASRAQEGEDLKVEDSTDEQKEKEESRPLVAPMKGNL